MNTSPKPTPTAILLDDAIQAVQKAAETNPTGILILSPHRQTLTQLIQLTYPNLPIHSCASFLLNLALPSECCLQDVDTPGKMVEAALKALFTKRPPNTTIIGLAASEHSVAATLLRAGRFEKIIHVRAPSLEARREAWGIVLDKFCKDKVLDKVPADAADELARVSPGFDVADFATVATDALERTELAYESLKELVSHHAPKGDIMDIPVIEEGAHEGGGWERVGGYERVKQELERLIEWPIVHEATFERLGVSVPRGVLLHGPRGCGKTLLARTFARRLKSANWLLVNAGDLYSKWLGESEANVRRLFARARRLTPCVIVLDELECVGMRRDEGGVEGRVLGAFLTELDGVEGGGVFVVGCCKDVSVLDPALIRPGRLDHLVEVAKPGRSDREDILRVVLKEVPVMEKEEVVRMVAEMEGSGAELVALCREAAMVAMEEEEEPESIGMRHFRVAMERTRKGKR